MTKLFCCSQCGNFRGLFPEACEFCGSQELPISHAGVVKVDLEWGKPTVDEALRNFERHLKRADELDVRALLVLHGYGSSGQGGLIRRRFRELLMMNEWANRVDEYFFGEDFRFLGELPVTPALKKELDKDRFLGNSGYTLLLLKHIPLSSN